MPRGTTRNTGWTAHAGLARVRDSALAGTARKAAALLAATGQGGDRHLVHVGDVALARIRESFGPQGGRGRRNPLTGLESFADDGAQEDSTNAVGNAAATGDTPGPGAPSAPLVAQAAQVLSALAPGSDGGTAMQTAEDRGHDAADPGSASPGQLAQQQRTAVPVTLRNFGPTYLDSEFAQKIAKFDDLARQNGVTPQYISGYRTPEKQDVMFTLQQGTTPARQSLHSAGLAIDLQYLGLPASQQAAILNAARGAGLAWGGNFRNPGSDPNHFYFDPGGNRAGLIRNFTSQVQSLQGAH